MLSYQYTWKVLFLASWLCCGLASALPTDQSQPLKAISDSAELDQIKLIATYAGHVQLDQGTTHLAADRVIIKLNAAHEVIEATAYGNPAIYQTIPRKDKSQLNAQASVIDYFPSQQLVKLLTQALVTQDGNSYSAPHIEYDAAKQVVASPQEPKGRTTIILQPHKSSKKQ